jgi:hypothetical protein
VPDTAAEIYGLACQGDAMLQTPVRIVVTARREP